MFIKIVCRDHSTGLESGYGSGDDRLSGNSLEGRREVGMEDGHTGSPASSVSLASVKFPESPRHERWHPVIPNQGITQACHYNS